MLVRPADSTVAQAQLRDRLERIVTNNPVSPFGITGGIFSVAAHDDRAVTVALGHDAAGLPLTETSLIHLASASKLATGLLLLRLVERGLVKLNAEIGAYLPEAAAARTPGVTIRRMLGHTSGLPLEVGHDLSEPPGGVQLRPGMRWPNELAEACLRTAPTHAPGTLVQYSNVAFGLLGLIAERVTGRDFVDLLDEFVFSPLSVRAFVGRPAEGHVMAVSDIPSPLAGTDLEPYNSPTLREWGTPWAGVLTDAIGLIELVRAYSRASSLLPSAIASQATSDQTDSLSGGFVSSDAFLAHGPSRAISWSPCPWGLAVELQGGKQPHWAPSSMPRSFGQIGSSGCLGWHDPDSGVSWAFAGARTTESGWLVRHGVRIAQSALAAARAISDKPMQPSLEPMG